MEDCPTVLCHLEAVLFQLAGVTTQDLGYHLGGQAAPGIVVIEDHYINDPSISL